VFEKRGNISNANVLTKNVLSSVFQISSANVSMMSPSDLLATPVLNAFRTLHSFIIERHIKLVQVQIEIPVCAGRLFLSYLTNEFFVDETKVKDMENISVFHFILRIQSCIAFSVHSK